MAFTRGDIVEVNLGLPPDGRVLNHPAIIISNNEVFYDDDCYLVVMLTSQQYSDKYSFEITSNMLVNPNSKAYSEARCHLITYILPTHIVNNKIRNKVRRQFVDALVEHIVNSALY